MSVVCVAKSGKKPGKKGAKEKEEEEEQKAAEDHTLKPTRAISAYIFFSNETVPKLKAEEGISHKEAMGKAGKIWNDLSEEAKKPYNKMHDEDVVR